MNKDNADILQFIKGNNFKENNIKNSFEIEEKNFYYNKNLLNNDDYEEKIKSLKIQYNMFKIFIYNKLHKREYKTVLNQINGNFQTYEILPESKEMLFLKLETIIKIIFQKINKYERIKNIRNNVDEQKYKSYSFSKNSIKLLKDLSKRKLICNIKQNQIKLSNINTAISLENYYFLFNKEIMILINEISNFFQNSQVIYIEKIIQLYLKLLLVKSYHHLKINQIIYSNYYLSLGKLLISSFKDYIKDIQTLELSQKTYLYITLNLIKNKDFKKAEKNCFKIYNFCIRQLIFKYGDINLINSHLKHEEKKVFLNLSLVLLYIGFCKEEKGKINKAINYYKLSLFITEKFLGNEYKKFSKFINNLITRTKKYKKIFLGLKEKGIDFLKEKKNSIENISNSTNSININFSTSNNFSSANEEKIRLFLMNHKIKNSKIKLMKNQKLENFLSEKHTENENKKEKKKKEEMNLKNSKKIIKKIELEELKKNIEKFLLKGKYKGKKLRNNNNIKINNSYLKSYLRFLPKNNKIELLDSRNNINMKLFNSEKKKKRIKSAISNNNNSLKKVSSCPNLLAIDDSFKSSYITFSINKLFSQNKNKLSFLDTYKIICSQNLSENEKKKINKNYLFQKGNPKNAKIHFSDKIFKNYSNENISFPFLSERNSKKCLKRIFSYQNNE